MRDGVRAPGARWWNVRVQDGSPSRAGSMPGALVVFLALGFLVWFHLDVGLRAEIVPLQPDIHKTDFTVFTEAGAAFFDGRDPYAVTNPRGWFYLYPPLFALMVAPLSVFDTVAQAMAWFVISVVLGYGCVIEARRIWVRIAPSTSGRDALGRGVALCAGLTVVLPSLECLQRGQVGIALLYALLLGFRLAALGGGWSVVLGGVVLAWAATVKVIPALPVGFLVFQQIAMARPLRGGVSEGEGLGRRPALGRAAGLGAGVIVGAFLFLLAVPGLILGWGENLRHLETWSNKVVTNRDPGKESGFHIDSTTNQSFSNGAYRLSQTLSGATAVKPHTALMIRIASSEVESRWFKDKGTAELRRASHATRAAIRGVQGLTLVLLLALGLSARRDDPGGQAAGFGMACLAMLLVSPIAWTHYYMMALPAVIGVPLWLGGRGQPRCAWVLAISPALLVWAHYLAKPWAGPVGLLGLGSVVWFLVAGTIMLRSRQPQRDARPPGPSTRSGRRTDSARGSIATHAAACTAARVLVDR